MADGDAPYVWVKQRVKYNGLPKPQRSAISLIARLERDNSARESRSLRRRKVFIGECELCAY